MRAMRVTHGGPGSRMLDGAGRQRDTWSVAAVPRGVVVVGPRRSGESAEVVMTCPGRNFVTLRITTDDGLTGWGDATVNGREPAAVRAEFGPELPLLHPSDAPGLGVEVDQGVAARFPYRAAYLPVNRLADRTPHDW